MSKERRSSANGVSRLKSRDGSACNDVYMQARAETAEGAPGGPDRRRQVLAQQAGSPAPLREHFAPAGRTDRRTPTGPSAATGSLTDGARAGRRLLVISHPAVVNVNQEVYRELARRGWDVTIVVPRRWRNEYSKRVVAPETLEGLEASLRPRPVALAGRPQRHFYLMNSRAFSARVRPVVAFVEAEPFSLAAAQWSRALTAAKVPFGVQCAENIDRSFPAPVRWLRSRVLREAAFVAARSESAARLARAWGASGEVALAPHAVPDWERAWERTPVPPKHAFTVGYAGRLVESKGLSDLLSAVRLLDAPAELLLIGYGELRGELEGQPIPGSAVRVLSGLSHDRMPSGYAQLDVLVLPSHTTPTWKEQFGRVIVEALWCGVPVIGSDSGEIPWLIELTGGGLIFPEGDRDGLARQLVKLRESPELRAQLARRGRIAVETLFSVPAATDSLEDLMLHALGRDQIVST
jgi:glycosyltransferase involved in cell wall biosynthesis